MNLDRPGSAELDSRALRSHWLIERNRGRDRAGGQKGAPPPARDDIAPGFGDGSSSEALRRTSGCLMENRDV
jgi:hypothetical protein